MTGAMAWPNAMPSMDSACCEHPFQKNQFQNERLSACGEIFFPSVFSISVMVTRPPSRA